MAHEEAPPDMGAAAAARARRGGESPEIEAAFAALADIAAMEQREAALHDESPLSPPPMEADRGVGNFSEYLAPTPLPSATAPADDPPMARVAIVMAEVPRQLPLGDRAGPTVKVG